jgi:eukaryotic-like serine/threonine-protein kinase
MSSNPVSDSQWNLKKEIFLATLELPADEQEKYLAALTISDPMRAEIQQMLKFHSTDDSFLKSPFEKDGSQTETKVSFDPLIGKTLDGFTIESLIGWGGMGAVYVARQSNPARQVALKVLNHRQRQLPHHVLRFEHEIAVLARLDHPGIAKVHAAGSFDFGGRIQPWFVMELVNAPTLKKHLESAAPNTTEILQILVQICEAVQHAHDRGVIHRDLKPSNILVSSQSESAQHEGKAKQIKIVDFGIALMVNEDLNCHLTLDGEILGTLSYMSPEQICQRGDKIDGRTDVFAIGMIGFEMLCGQLAFDRQGCSLSDIVARAGRELPFRLRQLDSSFASDLEAVFDAALQPDPNQRYLSAADLARDLKRCLAGERPLVRKPSVVYRTRRFVANHLGIVVGTSATILALCVGLFFYATEARRVAKIAEQLRYEANKSQAINDFISNDLIVRLIGSNEDVEGISRSQLSQLTQQATENIDTMFGDQPAIEAAIRNEVGTIFHNLRMFERAATEYTRAMELWEAELGPEHNDTLKAVNNLGQACLAQSKLEIAEPLLLRAFEGRLRTLGSKHTLTLNSMLNVAQVYFQSKRMKEAEPMLLDIVKIKQSLGQDSDKTTLTAMASLGAIYIQLGRLDDALQIHLESFQLGKNQFGDSHPTTLSLAMRAAQTLHRVGRNGEAETLINQTLPALKAVSGSDSLETINALRLLARITVANNDSVKAVEHLQMAESALLEGSRNQVLLKKVQQELKATQKSNLSDQN